MKKFIQSFSVAFKGIREAVTSQRNVKIHIAVALITVAAGIYVDLSGAEWGLIAFAIGLVLSAELLNTAIEKLTDLLEPRQHPLAGTVKDMAAGGVLIAAVTALIIGVLVFAKYLPV